MNCESLICNCKNRWKIDDCPVPEEKFVNFENTLPDFIGRFKGRECKIIEELLAQYDYFTHSSINTSLKELHEKVLNVASITEESRVIYCVLPSSNGKLNSSSDYLSEYRQINRINKDVAIQNMDDFDLWDIVETVVFIDDICGSGSTMEKFFKKKKNMEKISGKSIVYAVVYAMKDSIEYVNKLAESYGISLKVVTLHERDKAFIRLGDKKRETFGKMSKHSGISKESDIYGFKQSEATVSFYNNTPNNTLGLFAIDTNQNKALFHREKTVGTPWIIKARKKESKRKNENKALYSKRDK